MFYMLFPKFSSHKLYSDVCTLQTYNMFEPYGATNLKSNSLPLRKGGLPIISTIFSLSIVSSRSPCTVQHFFFPSASNDHFSGSKLPIAKGMRAAQRPTKSEQPSYDTRQESGCENKKNVSTIPCEQRERERRVRPRLPNALYFSLSVSLSCERERDNRTQSISLTAIERLSRNCSKLRKGYSKWSIRANDGSDRWWQS